MKEEVRGQRPEVKERPILFSGPMVRAILEGRKTQTRRVMRIQPEPDDVEKPIREATWPCPYGKAGDRLWVRENFRQSPGSLSFHYKADVDEVSGGPWKPSIHMPRAGSRITLEITNVRIERLQQLSRRDAIAEGMQCASCNGYHSRRCVCVELFEKGWDALNAKRGYSWESNPCVWVIEFKRIQEVAS